MNSATGNIERAFAYAAKVPPAISGQGGHDQTFALACALVRNFGLGEHDLMAVLRDYNTRCIPPWSERELSHKARSALQAAGYRPKRMNYTTRKVAIDPVTALENYLGGLRCTEADLWELSPVRPPEDWTKDGAALVAHLYEPGEKINFVTEFFTSEDGKASPRGIGESVERDELIQRWSKCMPVSDAGGWLRMNPVDGAGVGDSNVTAFRFGLIEFDAVPIDLQIPLIAKLPLPVAAILTSGGRSVHAWVKIDAKSLDEFKATMARCLGLLSRFGADEKNKNASRLSRLPGVTRRIGASGDGKQRLLYLNPNPEQKAIL